MLRSDIEKDAARFALLCFMAVFNGLNIRTESLNLFTGLNRNKAFVGIGLGILLMAVLLCNVVGGYVGATALTLTQWNYIIGLALLVIPVDLIRKAICKNRPFSHFVKFRKAFLLKTFQMIL